MTINEAEDPWSLTRLCEGEYTACQTWRDEKEARWATGHGALETLETADAEERERRERSAALREAIVESEQDAQREW